MAYAFSGKKSYDEYLDYTWLFAKWLSTGDRIVSATVTALPSDLIVSGPLVTDTAVTVWLSGGTTGQTYNVTCVATTSAGRVVHRSASLVVGEP